MQRELLATDCDILSALRKAHTDAVLESESISDGDKESARELLDELEIKIQEDKKTGIIKAAFTGLRDFLIGVGASITAELLIAKYN